MASIVTKESEKNYPVPVDRFGRKWPELRLPNHKAWICDDCGQPDVRAKNPCKHKKLPKELVKKLGGKLR